MKKLRLLLSCALAFTAVLACSDDEDTLPPNEEPDVTDEWYAENASISSEDTNFTATDEGGTIEFESVGGKVTVTVDCGTDWTFSKGEDAEWLSVDENGTKLVITASVAEDENERSAEIELTTAQDAVWFATIEVTQKGLTGDEEYPDEWYAENASISSEDPYFTATDEGGTITFKSAAASVTVNVDCGTGWTFEKDEEVEWLTVEATEDELVISVTATDMEEERNSEVTLTTAKDSVLFATIGIVQAGLDALEITVDERTWSVPAVGDSNALTKEIAVNSSIDEFDVAVDDESKDWLTAEKTETGIKLTAAENEETTERKGTVTVTCTDGNRSASETIAVTQDARVFLSVTRNEDPIEAIELGPEAGEVSVAVESNYEWDVTDPTESWLSVTKGENGLTIAVTANDSFEEREGTVTLTAGDGAQNTAEVPVKVSQKGVFEIILETDEWNAPAVGTLTKDITVTSPSDFEVTVDDSAQSWLSAQKGENKITLTVQENAETTSREGTVTLTSTETDGDRTDTKTITVAQDGKAYITVADFLIFSFDSDSQNVAVESNFDWTVTGPSDSWLTVTSSNGQLAVSVNANETEEKRESSFTLSAGDGAENTAEAEVSVRQTGNVFTLEYTITSAGTTVTLPLNGTVNCTIDWFDGSEEETFTTVRPTHTYASAGVYEVAIYGTATEVSHVGITVSTATDNDLTNANTTLTAIKSWGGIQPTTFAAGFSGCTALKTIPETTGSALSKPTSWARAFYHCESLESIPADLFAESTEVTTTERTFMYCYALKEIPKGLFKNCAKLKTIVNTFRNCSSITAIPDGFFEGTEKVLYQVSYCFCDSGVETYPDDLFKDCTELKTIRAFFYNCPITSIPKDLFKDCTAVNDQLDYLFCGTQITEVPEGLFDTFTGSSCKDCRYMFRNCTKLTTVPTSLFDKMKYITQLDQCFYGCTALTGESPYYMDGETKVHLYDRTGLSSYTNCFRNCTKLDDYDDIPDGWK